MSRIIIDADFAREIHNTLSTGVSKDPNKQSLHNYLFTCCGGKLTAVCCDGYSIRQITGDAMHTSGKCEMRVPVFGRIDKKVNTVTFETIDESVLKIIITIKNGTQEDNVISNANEPFLDNWRELLKKPANLKAVSLVTPDLLSAALLAMSTKESIAEIATNGGRGNLYLSAKANGYEKSAVVLPRN